MTEQFIPGRLTVQTITPPRFEELCEMLVSRVCSRAGDWDLAVGIADSGLYLLPYFARPGAGMMSVSLKRKGSGAKKSRAANLLRHLPLQICNFLRIAEARFYEFKDKHWKKSRQRLPFFSPQLDRDLRVWRRNLVKEGSPLIVVVDDAADSGRTLTEVASHIRQSVPDAKVLTAVLTATRPAGSKAADIALFRNGTLMRFPWAPDYRPAPGEKPWPEIFGSVRQIRASVAVIVDLDGTLLTTNSFSRFVAWLPIAAPSLLPKVGKIFLNRKLRKITHAQAKQEILAASIPKLKEPKIEAWVDSLLKEYLRENLSSQLAALKKDGTRLILATAAPQLYASIIARVLGFDFCLATEQGAEECKGEEKARRVEELLKEQKLFPSKFFSDHDDDLPLARRVAAAGGEVVWV